MRRVVWFSCGAASAVAAKLAVDTYGDECEIHASAIEVYERVGRALIKAAQEPVSGEVES